MSGQQLCLGRCIEHELQANTTEGCYILADLAGSHTATYLKPPARGLCNLTMGCALPQYLTKRVNRSPNLAYMQSVGGIASRFPLLKWLVCVKLTKPRQLRKMPPTKLEEHQGRLNMDGDRNRGCGCEARSVYIVTWFFMNRTQGPFGNDEGNGAVKFEKWFKNLKGTKRCGWCCHVIVY